jgi:hypothetical protein
MKLRDLLARLTAAHQRELNLVSYLPKILIDLN